MNYSYSFCYVVFNGGIYLWNSLRNALELCRENDSSEIIVVEGYDNFRDSSEIKNSSSVDGTAAIVKSFNTDRIKFFSIGRRGDKRQLKNYCLTKRQDTDFIFLRSEDEIMKLGDFKRVNQKLDQVDVVDLRMVYFWGDFRHKIPDSLSPFEEKIIRNIGGIGWIDWYDQINLIDGGKFREKGKLLNLEVPIYRYRYVKPKERLIKDRFQIARERNWFHKSVGHIEGWKVVEPNEWARKLNPFVMNCRVIKDLSYDDLYTCQLKDHPSEMEEHPFSLLEKEEIWSQPVFPTFLDLRKAIPANLKSPLNILEVGCGPGLVLKQFTNGNECWGLDPSPFAVKHGRSLGLKMTKGILERTWFESNYFDLIFGIDVIEHTKDPRKALENLVKWLKPSGSLILAWPNPEADWIRDKKHFLWSPLQHFSIPSKKIIRQMAIDLGLEIAYLEIEGHNLWLKALKRGNTE